MVNLRFEKYLVGYCGYYCRKCDYYTGVLRDNARGMLNLVEKHGELEGIASSSGLNLDFRNFVKCLRWLSDIGLCLGCRAGDGWSACPVRKCVLEKGLDGCWVCKDFPCDKIKSFEAMVKSVKEIREKGLDRYILDNL